MPTDSHALPAQPAPHRSVMHVCLVQLGQPRCPMPRGVCCVGLAHTACKLGHRNVNCVHRTSGRMHRAQTRQLCAIGVLRALSRSHGGLCRQVSAAHAHLASGWTRPSWQGARRRRVCASRVLLGRGGLHRCLRASRVASVHTAQQRDWPVTLAASCVLRATLARCQDSPRCKTHAGSAQRGRTVMKRARLVLIRVACVQVVSMACRPDSHPWGSVCHVLQATTHQGWPAVRRSKMLASHVQPEPMLLQLVSQLTPRVFHAQWASLGQSRAQHSQVSASHVQ